MSTSLLRAWEDAKPEVVAVDTETTGLTFYDTPFLASFWWGEEGYAVALGSEEGRQTCRKLLADTPTLLFHNAKFDIQKLNLVGLFDRGVLEQHDGHSQATDVRGASSLATDVPSGVHDTEAIAHLLNEHRRKGLKPLAREVLNLETDEAEAIAKARRKHKLTKADGLDKLYAEEPQLVIDYAIKDVEFTWKLFWHLWPQISRFDDLLSLYELERELMWVLLDMETAGMAVDTEYVQEASKEYAGRVLKAEWKIEDATGLKVFKPIKSGQKTPEGHINPNSPDQLKKYFNGKGIESESYDKSFLKTLDDPFAEALLELRAASKINNTYLQPMLNETKDGIMHPNFRQHGTRGRRMSAGEAEG